MSLADLVTVINDLSAASQFNQLLTHLQSQEEMMIQQLPQLDEVLPALRPMEHSLGMVFILKAKAAAVPLSNLQAVHTFLQQCRRLLLEGDPVQVQMVPSHFATVCAKFSNAAVAIAAPAAALRPLQHAAQVLQPSPAHFTPVHTEVLRVALLARHYPAAVRLLDASDLLEVAKDKTGVAPRDLLLYHYYAGLACCGLHRFSDAVRYLTLCYSAPTHVVHAAMVEAYKKCVLASLLATGEQPAQPKYTALPIQRYIKTGVPAYSELAEAFATHSPAELRSAITKHEATFARDRNLGLARQCVGALVRRSIRRLTQAYLTLSLADIAAVAQLESPAEAEGHVVAMVAAGDISATIDEPQGMVHFSESADAFDSPSAVAAMEASINGAIGVATKLQAMHAQLCTDSQYLSRVMRERVQSRWEDDGMGMGK